MIRFCLSGKDNALKKGIHEAADKNGYFFVYSKEEVMAHCSCNSKIHILDIKQEDVSCYVSPDKIKVRKMQVLKTLPLWSLQTIEQLYTMNVNLRAGEDVFAVCAVRNGFLDIVQFLTEEAGVSVNASSFGLLKWAAFGGSIQVARYLLQKGADPDYGNMAALKEAVKRKDEKMTALLLMYGAKTRENKRDESLLCLAIEQEDYEIIRLLLDAEAEAIRKYNNSFERAIEVEHMPILKLFCEDKRLHFDLKRKAIVHARENVKDKNVKLYLDKYFEKFTDNTTKITRLLDVMEKGKKYSIADLTELLHVQKQSTVRYSFVKPALENKVIQKVITSSNVYYKKVEG